MTTPHPRPDRGPAGRAERAPIGHSLLHAAARIPEPVLRPLVWFLVVLACAGALLVTTAARGWTLLAGAVIFVLWFEALRNPRRVLHSLRRPEEVSAVGTLSLPSDERSLRIAERSTLMTQWILAPVLWVGFLSEMQQGAVGPVTWLCGLDSALLVGTAVWVSRRM
jgi:hypothetical protein